MRQHPDVIGTVAVEGPAAVQHLVQDAAECEDVGPRAGLAALELLGDMYCSVPTAVPSAVNGPRCAVTAVEASAVDGIGACSLASPKSSSCVEENYRPSGGIPAAVAPITIRRTRVARTSPSSSARARTT